MISEANMQTTEWPGKNENFRGKRAEALIRGRKMTDAESICIFGSSVDVEAILQSAPMLEVVDEWIELNSEDMKVLCRSSAMDVEIDDN